MANFELGLLTVEQKDAIIAACGEILDGKHHDQFPVDMIQGGAGTTTNMNANEVIANRALELMGHERGEYQYCSPNDHVNCSQSTNDAYPTAIHIGMYFKHLQLLPHLEELIASFRKKGEEFSQIIKMGRTQLEDAVPMTLGQTFNGFASILQDEIAHLNEAAADFLVVNMGATAIGTGICAEPGYAEKCIAALREITGWDIRLSSDLVGATSDTSCLVGYASAMKRVCVKMNKICNDLRLLASGPRCGLGEFNLPAMQPGSSIMPGKVNPVIPEVMNQIAYKVMGNELCVTMAGEAAQMELNAMEPVFGLPVGEVSKALGRGRHTTRHVEMFPLDEDTYVIDTPGFSSFDTEELDLELKARLPETFPEFAPYLGQCRFVGCSHVKEKGCAVLQAVKDGRIPASRHRSYVRLYDELKDLRDWQHK